MPRKLSCTFGILGCLLLSLPFWIATYVLLETHSFSRQSTLTIVDLHTVSILFWYIGFSIGVPAAFVALYAKSKAGKWLSVSVITFALAFIVMGSMQRRALESGIAGEHQSAVLGYALVPLVLWLVSLGMAIKAMVNEHMDSKREK